MASVMTAPGLPQIGYPVDHDTLNTNTPPDARTPDASQPISRSGSTSPHPDLNSEVASLSNKLIFAINQQTGLEDSLTSTKHDLEVAQRRIQQLENEAQRHRSMMASGEILRKSEVESELTTTRTEIAEERRLRTIAEDEKKKMEQELEGLTLSLFEEANEMVSTARREREPVEKRNEQLKTQLKDMEILLSSHQEQLAELKTVLANISLERDEQDNTTNGSTAPSTPAVAGQSDMSRVFDALHMTPRTEDIPPAPPTSFSHLLSPVLRTDLQTYEDFKSLVQTPRKSNPGSRVSSGSYAGINVLGLGQTGNRDSNGTMGHIASNGSQTSLHNVNIDGAVASPTIPLKETRFYKRALTEDIEPTLRLDTAPGLSWLNRRAVINSMSEGSLVVEPMPASVRKWSLSCSLCGENRKGEQFERTHRFKTSETETAQRYPLCQYCLNRVRATCDYLGFLRMVKNGHWRTEGAEAEKMAWEESVRLRERMFWARIGGGVVPTIMLNRDSPRMSTEQVKRIDSPSSAALATNGEIPSGRPSQDSRTVEETSPPSEKENQDPEATEGKSALPPKKFIARRVRGDDDWMSARNAAIFDDVKTMPPPPPPRSTKRASSPPDGSVQQLQSELAASVKNSTTRPLDNAKLAAQPTPPFDTVQEPEEHYPPPMSRTTSTDTIGKERGLSITIPGSFEF
ncbi:rab guanine nucleotide exchange factor S2 [Agyrium rufum]|nr:rab guanine nucleotide exchange factor S2 [Agyrium rufum]